MARLTETVHLRRDGSLSVLEFESGAGTLDRRGVESIVHAAEAAAADGWTSVLLLRSKSAGNFFTGGGALPTANAEASAFAAAGQRLFGRLASLPCVTVAWLEGPVIGAGLELALACDYRLAVDSFETTFGFPEMRDGALPAHGGITRLVRQIGAAAAVELLTAPELWSVAQARSRGLVDAVMAGAVDRRRFLDRLCERPEKPRRWSTPLDGWAARRVVAAYRRWLDAHRHTLVAEAVRIVPLAAHDAVLGFAAERSAFAASCENRGCQAARALRHDELALIGRVDADLPGVVAVCGPIARAAELVAECTLRGITVHACHDEPDEAPLDAALKGHVERGRISAADAQRARGRVQFISGMPAGRACLALITRATARNLEIAEQWPGTPLMAVVNSKPAALARLSSGAEMLFGLNLFDGSRFAAEIVEAPAASPAAFARLCGWLTRLGRTPIIVGTEPGSWLRPLQRVLCDEAVRLVADGVPIEIVDRAARSLGAGHGPLELLDGIGFERAARKLPRLRPLLAAGIRGRPHGEGFYVLESDGPTMPNAVAQLVLMESADGGHPLPRLHAEVDPVAAAGLCRERIAARLAVRAVRLLTLDARAGPAEMDVAIVRGLGMFRDRGGLLRSMDARGLHASITELQALRARFGRRFQPPAELLRRAAADEPFHGDFTKPAERWPLKLSA